VCISIFKHNILPSVHLSLVSGKLESWRVCDDLKHVNLSALSLVVSVVLQTCLPNPLIMRRKTFYAFLTAKWAEKWGGEERDKNMNS
jgi:hypothetical protein